MSTLSIILIIALAVVIYWGFAILLFFANIFLGVTGMEKTILCKVNKKWRS